MPETCEMGRAGAEGAGVAACCCCAASLWSRWRSFRAQRFRFLLSVLQLCVSVTVIVRWLPRYGLVGVGMEGLAGILTVSARFPSEGP